ncbi:DUF1361 domain-containing protein [Gordonia cholesterolivorans]|uniref:DUF1361 domain-containing protein n=2 Tax=Gordoniaceae TaxID=85026 RepID=A0ABN3HPL4_9ACTN
MSFTWRRLALIGALAATTALTIVVGVTDPHAPLVYPTRFLIWNLFLAWLPLLIACAFVIVRNKLALIPLGLAWLAFLPNAPYLITDLVHLGEGYELWRHILQYGFAAWTGVMLGVVSMRLVHRRIEADWGRAAGWAAVAASVILCAVGVVIGRFQRWNSWDLVTRPDAVVAQTMGWVRSPFAHVHSSGVAVAVAVFLAAAYLTMWTYESIGDADH